MFILGFISFDTVEIYSNMHKQRSNSSKKQMKANTLLSLQHKQKCKLNNQEKFYTMAL